MENTGVSLRPKAEKYIQRTLRAGKRSFMGKSWEPRSTALLSVCLCLGLIVLLCRGLNNCQSISVYGSLTLPGPLELRMILLLFILLENYTFHSFTSTCAEPYPASQLSVLFLYLSSILQFCSFRSMSGMPLPHLYVSLSARLKCHLLISLYCFTSHSVISDLFQKVKSHTFVLVYLLMSFSLTRKQAEGLSPLCFVHLGSQCLVYSWSPVNVSLTCSCLAVIHLLEV